jgi:hypothetical protein
MITIILQKFTINIDECIGSDNHNNTSEKIRPEARVKTVPGTIITVQNA